ncbi:hydroxysteroid (20-beta) dehydrogenase 2 isoform X1 [Stegostoma tigrinum]|uniref:hydroxysteroid (20-beta) dehydrogenase 2 isoform X1 n=1 Tax=Stegostoma tigrinum TaxID=3053191 RepID=UPI0028700CA7|nr:hydroxysteroid (20-beta) dehydrogenase 2 isoform X1 [Stegostoma tigrinum]
MFFTDDRMNSILALIGTLTCLYYFIKYSWELLVGTRIYILAKFWRKNLALYGEWAVVTGATAGIGKAYAHELARRGLNVVLISRSLEKLRATADEIEQQHGKRTKILQADFNLGAEIYGPIEAALKDLNIGILVNNVGKTYQTLPCYFLDAPDVEKEILDILNCNVLSVLMMTRIVLPHLLKRRKGIIINISSEAGTHPHPLITMYSATKVFVDFFSQALNAEYKPNGIIVQTVLPLFVSTNLTHDAEINIFVKQADDYAREALNTVGLREKTNGCLSHALQHFFFERLFPGWLRLTQFNINNMKKLAERRKPLVEKWKSKQKIS